MVRKAENKFSPKFNRDFSRWFGILAIISWLLVVPSLAASRSLYWDSIQADIYINDDSSLSVVEKLDYVFTGEWNGGYRSINLKGLDEISNVELWEEKLQYVEGDLEKYHFTAERADGKLVIKWRSRNVDEPPYQDTRKTFILRYRVLGAINYLDGNDELYWKAIFEERDGVVKQGRAMVHFPIKVDPARLKVALFTGAPGATWRVQDEQTLVFSGSNLSPGELFEVQVKFPTGVVVRKVSVNKFLNQRISPFVVFLIPALAFLIMLYLYMRFGRDYEVKDIKRALEHKPSDLPPALAGTLIDERADLKEIMATLVDLARRGYIEITEVESCKFTLKLIKLPLNLMTFEIKLITDVFGTPLIAGSQVKMSDLRDKFYIHVEDLKNTIYEETLKLGYFEEDPRAVRNRFLIIGVILFILGAVPLFFVNLPAAFLLLWLAGFSGIPAYFLVQALNNRQIFQILFFLMFVLVGIGTAGVSLIVLFLEAEPSFFGALGLGISSAGIVVSAFSAAMPRKTLLGSREKTKWLGFRKYLTSGKKAEKFEEYLPYAVAFGITNSFLSGFCGQNLPAPTWFATSGLGQAATPDVAKAFGGGRSGDRKSVV